LKTTKYLIWKVKLKITISIIIIIINKFKKLLLLSKKKARGDTWCLAPAWGLGTPYAHVALGLCLWVGHSLAYTWPLGSHFWLVTSWAWVMALDSTGMGWSSGSMINGSSVRTQFYWVLYQDSIFMGIKIQNIIIIFIINIINKIINKFKRNYYYLYYNFLWHFLWK